jgi:hypothetical protein
MPLPQVVLVRGRRTIMRICLLSSKLRAVDFTVGTCAFHLSHDVQLQHGIPAVTLGHELAVTMSPLPDDLVITAAVARITTQECRVLCEPSPSVDSGGQSSGNWTERGRFGCPAGCLPA